MTSQSSFHSDSRSRRQAGRESRWTGNAERGFAESGFGDR
jgi:hypothetical protein